MKVGDLICYNAAGMRKYSLGLIVSIHIRTDNGKVKGVDTFYHIYWSKTPDILPRSEWADPRIRNGHDDRWVSTTNRTHWYKAGNWFEKVKAEGDRQ